MKLKKIASLMLAGIMAVSMLAACGEGKKDDSSSSSSSQVPVTSSLADAANAVLSGDQKAVFTYHNSDELNKALQAIASDKTKFTVAKVHAAYSNGTVAGHVDTDVEGWVKGKMNSSYTFVDWTAFAGSSATLPTNNGKTDKFIQAYMLSGELTEKGVAELVANHWKSFMNDTTLVSEIDENKISYSADIGAVKVTNPETDKETAWVIAVVVTRTASGAANAQA